MGTTQRRFGFTFTVILTAALAAACGDGGTGPDSGNVVTVGGQVFATATFQNNSTIYGPPVGGAVVSTSLDSTTATTDSSGNFRLVTTASKSQISGCTFYTVTIAAAGHPTYSVNGAWGQAATAQKFSLSPNVPGFVGCECPNAPPACRN